MPVEVRELIIRAEVATDPDDVDDPPVDTDEIIEMCVDQVLRILERSQER